VSCRVLTFADLPAVRRILAADPVSGVFVASRVDAGILSPNGPGMLYGWPDGEPSALLHLGANLVPVADTLDPIADFVETVGRRRTCQSIVGPARLALPLWEALGRRWGRSYSHVREVRPSQPLLAFAGSPKVAPDPRLRRIHPGDFESYYEASVAMYREEMGADPGSGPGSNYRAYCRWLVDQERAYGVVVDRRVVFKADLGAVGGGVGQIQGVWLEPSLRGQGASAAAMAAVAEYVLAEHSVACLYVNDFNVRAVRSYLRVGFEQVGELATVLY
jgi:uncharacterized protein